MIQMNNEKIKKINRIGDHYSVIGIPEEIRTNKKSNVYYWDGLEEYVEEVLKTMAGDAGIKVEEFGDYDLIKETTEFITKKIEERFPEGKFPYVDQDF